MNEKKEKKLIKFNRKITLKRMEDAKKIAFDDISSLFGITENAGGYYYIVERSKENFTEEYNEILKKIIPKLHNLIGELAFLTIQEKRKR